MDDIPWLYVAMIFIAFVSWVWQRIQEAAAIRRERIAERKRAERSRRTTEPPEWESPYQPRREPSPEPAPTPEEPKTFREVFKEIERQITEPEVETAPAPPPLPTSVGRDIAPDETIPPAYSPDVAVSPLRRTPPLAKKRKKTRRNRETSEALTGVLSDRGRLRTALILKEVLDKPKALRR